MVRNKENKKWAIKTDPQWVISTLVLLDRDFKITDQYDQENK